jgi:hypothetical protein
VPSKSWGLGRSLAAQAHVLAVVAPLLTAAQSLGVASGIGAFFESAEVFASYHLPHDKKLCGYFTTPR